METDNTGPCPVWNVRDLGKWAQLESCLKTDHSLKQETVSTQFRNWGPFACEANVITTTLWQQITLALAPFGTEEILESRLNLKVVSRQTTALNKRLFPPSFELGTFRVSGERDNHYTIESDNTGPCPVCY